MTAALKRGISESSPLELYSNTDTLLAAACFPFLAVVGYLKLYRFNLNYFTDVK